MNTASSSIKVHEGGAAGTASASGDAEQLAMLRDSAADVVQRGADMKRLRVRRGTLPGYEAAHLRQMADLGWLSILVPEAQGGLGLGLTEMATVLQELGRGLMADPLPAVALATRVLVHARHGPARQSGLSNAPKARHCPPWPGRKGWVA